MSSRDLHRPPLPTAAELCQPDHDDAATRQQHKRDQRRRHKLSHRLSRQILEVPAPGRQNWDWPSGSLPIGDDTIQREAMEMAKALKEECLGSSDSDTAVKQWLSGLKKLSKNNLLHNLLTGYHSKPSLFDRFDVHMVQDSRQLSDVLKTDFDFIKAAGSSKVVHTHDWDIRKQVESMGNGYCVAYQPAKSSKDNVFTQRIEAGDLGRIFLDKNAEVSEHGLNCLNLQNLSGRTFQPSAIGDVDLVGLIKRRLFTGNAGRQEGYLMANEEWMLLTHGPAFSPLHVDAAGYCTMLVILAGEKHWCTISGRWKQVFDEFVLRGPAGANYLHPICETSLAEGDLILQGPGTPHAVMTVDDSLAAGYFFYTAPHFARSIECVHRELAKEVHTNDEIGAKDFEKLALVMRHIDMEGLFTSEQKADIWTRLGFFLEDMGLTHRHGDVERRRKKSRSSGANGKTSRGGTRAESGKTEEAKQMFLDACVEWYRAKADA